MTEQNGTRLIKRYGNRKLYDTLDSRYITLDEIARLVREGSDVRVVDNENGDDLTAVTLAQIILEEEKRSNVQNHSSVLSIGLLRELVQGGEDTIAEIRSRVGKSVEAIGEMSEKAGRRVSEFVAGAVGGDRGSEGAESGEGGKGFLDELMSGPQRRLEALQKSIDDRIKSSVGRITAHPTVQHEIRRIERSIKKLEERLARLRNEHVEPPPGDQSEG